MQLAERLDNSLETREYLNSLPKVYALNYWADYAITEFPYAGEFVTEHYIEQPLVYDYYDGNGTCDVWLLRPISHTSTGFRTYSFDKTRLEEIIQSKKNNPCNKPCFLSKKMI